MSDGSVMALPLQSAVPLIAIIIAGATCVYLGVTSRPHDEQPNHHDLSFWKWALTAFGLAAVSLAAHTLFFPRSNSLSIHSPYLFFALLVIAIAFNHKLHGSKR